jgi:hypothetical protein
MYPWHANYLVGLISLSPLVRDSMAIGKGVIYVYAIKKVASYVYAMKKFPSTCMPRTRSSLTYMPFWMDSVRT